MLLLGVAALVWGPAAARAQDAFEIQVYQPDINEPGRAGLELHLNYMAQGIKTSASSELPTHHLFHTTLEPSFGLGHNWELGGYLQAAFGPDGVHDFAGAKVRAKVRLPSAGPFAFAVNAEIGWLPPRYDAARWGSEIRPIVEYRRGSWRIDVNPIVSFEWTGVDQGLPKLEPCGSVNYELTPRLAVGVEYYGALGPVTRLLPVAEQYHAVFVTTDVQLPAGFSAHLGVGGGLTPATNRLVFTSILGREF
jgi:hypothetical protein